MISKLLGIPGLSNLKGLITFILEYILLYYNRKIWLNVDHIRYWHKIGIVSKSLNYKKIKNNLSYNVNFGITHHLPIFII